MSEHRSDGRLRYRPDWPAARTRLAGWWHGQDLGRPALMIEAPRPEPWEDDRAAGAALAGHLPLHLPVGRLAGPPGPHRLRAPPVSRRGRAEVATGDVGPGSLALYLGCTGVEAPDTVWFEPCIAEPDTFEPRFDPDNAYWRFTNDVLDETIPWATGRFLHQFPDLIEGLDVVAALRGTEPMLYDLFDRPEWLAGLLQQLTALYFRYYDLLYNRIRDDLGGSVFWTWAPGRLGKLQCDCSAMLSPQQFIDLQVPVLAEMCERLSYSIYHLDGVDAVKHLEALLGLASLDVIQWTPGAGQPPVGDPAWYGLYARMLSAGKRVFLLGLTPDQALGLRRRFGVDSHRFLLALWLGDVATGEALVRDLER